MTITQVKESKRMPDLVGKNIHGFRITGILGEGGMGIVYKAYDVKLEREVAIKMLHARPNPSPRLLHQLRKEARHQAKLIHPNIVMVHGLLEHFSFLGIVMEYVEGVDLHQLLSQKGRLSVNETLQILRQALLGIEYAHSKGFIHRDIKPSNIIVNSEGVAKIMDFGISKSLYDSGNVETPHYKMGTIFYMSPEQIRGKGTSRYSDIYSIGCTAYEMLTGFPPFYYKTEFEVMQAHLNQLPNSFANVIYGIPAWLDQIVLKSLDKNPYNRFIGCEEMLRAINEGSRIVLHHVEPVITTPQLSKSYKAIRFFVVLILLIVLIAISYYVVKSVEFTKTQGPKPDPKKPQQIEKFID